MDETQIDSTAMNAVFAKLESSKPAANIEGMFENMQITVVGATGEENKSDIGSSNEEAEESDGDTID